MSRSGLNANDLLEDISTYDLDILAPEDRDGTLIRAIKDAELWIIAVLKRYGVVPEWSDSVIAAAVRKRAIYELHSLAGNDSRARDKKDDAAQLLRSLYALPDTGDIRASAVVLNPQRFHS